MKMKILIIVVLLAVSCDTLEQAAPPDGSTSSPEVPDNGPEVFGMNTALSSNSFEDTYTALKEALEVNTNISIVTEVDHSVNAATVDLALDPTNIVFFGNPNLGTPLMQQNQLAALDLPQRMLVYESAVDEVYLAYNNTDYLTNRYGLDPDTALPTIGDALADLARNAGNAEVVAAKNNDISFLEGIITRTSSQSFGDTYRSLKSAIENNENLKIVAEVNHRANARDIGLDLEPTRLIIFGNPNLGSPLMREVRTTALDLPQRMLVWRDIENVVYVSYNDPEFLKKRHGIDENDQILETISNALDNLSNSATGN